MRLLPVVGTILVFGGIPGILWYQHYNEVRENRVLDQLELQQYANQPPANASSNDRDFVARTQGENAAQLFEICRQSPPALPEERLKCQAIVNRMNRDKAAPPAEPPAANSPPAQPLLVQPPPR